MRRQGPHDDGQATEGVPASFGRNGLPTWVNSAGERRPAPRWRPVASTFMSAAERTPDGAALPPAGARAPRRRSVEGCGHDGTLRGRRRAQRAGVLHRRRSRRHPQSRGRASRVRRKRCTSCGWPSSTRACACSATTRCTCSATTTAGCPTPRPTRGPTTSPTRRSTKRSERLVRIIRERAPAGHHHVPRRAQLLPASRPHPGARDLGSRVRRGRRSRGVSRTPGGRGSRRSCTTSAGRSRA